jgi:hypothetical protein
VCQFNHLDPLTDTHWELSAAFCIVSQPSEYCSLVVAVLPLSLEGFSLGFKACNDGIDHQASIKTSATATACLTWMTRRDATESLVIELISAKL